VLPDELELVLLFFPANLLVSISHFMVIIDQSTTAVALLPCDILGAEAGNRPKNAYV
jgi:hypothetical protein